jgi:hypothetical protein
MTPQQPHLSRYRGFNIQIEHPRPGVCLAKLYDPMRPTERPEMILDRSTKDVVDFAVRWIDGVCAEEAGRVEQDL